MKIYEVMTRDVETLDESATLRDAARRMHELDIGSLPVVRRGKPVGIVTDRDIVVRAIAEGLDAGQATVGDIMTTDITVCRDDDDVHDAAAIMQDRQIRRLLVMDGAGQLCGVVSLGDLALRSDDDRMSEGVLEEVSAPTHPYRQHAMPRGRVRHGHPDGHPTGAANLCSLAAGAAGGAALMYLFDPQRGRRRRALVRDQFTHARRRLAINARKTAEYTGDRTRGMLAETAARFRRDEPSDAVLVERVRAAMGRAVSHPGAIEVEAIDGVVSLHGPVLADEAENLLAAVENVRGVRKVEDHLELHATREEIPALQGTGRRRRRPSMARQSASPTTRLLSGVTGAALASWGVARRDLLGAGVGLVGAALAARSLTDLPPDRLTGIGAGRRAVDVHKTIRINAPLEAVFDFWSNFENFPRTMTNVRDVQDYGNGRSHWVVAGPAGSNVEWDAELTQYVPRELIAWKSTDDSVIQSSGVVRFQPDDAGGTRVDVNLSYNPPGGAIGHALAKVFGADPKSEMDQDLMRLKTMLETGHAPHDAARRGEAVAV